MAGGIALSAKFDVSIAEPLDSKLESVSTFSELASTEFPYKGMQKLVEDEGDNGIIYHLGADLTTWSTSTDEDALKQGSNTLTEDLSISGDTEAFDVDFNRTTGSPSLIGRGQMQIKSTDAFIEVYRDSGQGGFLNIDPSISTSIGCTNINGDDIFTTYDIINSVISIQNQSGNGIKFNDRTVDEANVDFATDDNNLLSIGKAKENLLQQGDNTLTDTLKLGPFSPLIIANTFVEVDLTSIRSNCTEISTNDTSSSVVNVGNVTSTVQNGSDLNELLISAINGIVFKSEILGNGIKFNDRAVDEANVDFSTDDNNLLSIGKAKENLLQQGSNTLTEDLEFVRDSGTSSLGFGGKVNIDIDTSQFLVTNTNYSDNSISFFRLDQGIISADFGASDGLGNPSSLKISSFSGITIEEEILGKGIKFNNRTVDEANVDFSTDDNNLLSIGKAKENLQQKHTVTDFTDAFTIPNGTNNATLTMTNATNKDVTITATSFANVGDACELSSLLGVGYPIVVAATGVALVDPNGVASDSFNIKGLRRMNDVGGVVQIQLY